MIKHYFSISLKMLIKNKLFSIINIGGLALGLALAILILLFVRSEFGYEDWVNDGFRVARMESTWMTPGRNPIATSKAPPPSSIALKEYFPNEIDVVSRLRYVGANVISKGRMFAEKINFVDPDFFKIFNLNILEGSTEAVHFNNKSLIISKQTARKYFGENSPINEVLTLDGADDYVIVGVFDDVSNSSHLDLNFVTALDTGPFPWMTTGWDYVDNFYHYVKFRAGYGIEDIEGKMTAFVANKAISESPDPNYQSEKAMILDFIPLLDIHLRGKKSQQIKPGGNYVLVISFVFFAVLILTIGSINFLNLSIANAMPRAREISVRKVFGATRHQLFGQFLGEAMVTAIFAYVIALVLIEIALPFYNEFLGMQLSLDFIAEPLQALGFFTLALMVGICGGIYPALVLSNSRPVKALRTKVQSQSGSAYLQQAFVIFQFSVSIGLIVVTLVISSQTDFATKLDLGFNEKNKYSIKDINAENMISSAETLRQKMLDIPQVNNVAWASDTIPKTSSNNISFSMQDGAGQQIASATAERMYVDNNFFDLLEIQPIAGRVYSPEFTSDALIDPTDKSLPYSRNAVVNERFIRFLEYSSADEIIGKEFSSPNFNDGRNLNVKIVGVVRDFHLRSAREHHSPMIFFASTSVLKVMTLGIRGNAPTAITEIERVWHDAVPGIALQGSFIEDEYHALYSAEQRSSKLFAVFAIFAVIVTCSGLYGLTSFSVAQRRKEIGVRKLLGATISDILGLLSWQFLKPVIWANLIAWPLAYFALRDWLDGFVYRVDLSWGVFLLAGLIALVIAWLTVSSQAYLVARSSLIRALRCD